MPSFGENLRREREMRGVTLEEMSATTKISVRLLAALEQDRFTELPGGVFTRSFIRAYAQYLGLDEEHVLSEYKRAAKPATDNDLSRLTPSAALGEHAPRTRVLPWVIIAILLGSGYAVYRYSRRSSEAVPTSSQGLPISPAAGAHGTPSTPTSASGSPQNSTQTPESTPAPIGDAQVSGGAKPSGPAGNDNQSTGGTAAGAKAADPGTPTESPAGPSSGRVGGAQDTNAGTQALGQGDMILQVTTSEEAWIAVAADGKTLMQHLLPANSTRIFRAKDAFDVTTGNAQGTVLTFNGTPQKSLGREGEFKRVHLARNTDQNPAH